MPFDWLLWSVAIVLATLQLVQAQGSEGFAWVTQPSNAPTCGSITWSWSDVHAPVRSWNAVLYKISGGVRTNILTSAVPNSFTWDVVNVQPGDQVELNLVHAAYDVPSNPPPVPVVDGCSPADAAGSTASAQSEETESTSSSTPAPTPVEPKSSTLDTVTFSEALATFTSESLGTTLLGTTLLGTTSPSSSSSLSSPSSIGLSASPTTVSSPSKLSTGSLTPSSSESRSITSPVATANTGAEELSRIAAGEAAGIAVAICGLLIAIVLITWFYLRRRKRRLAHPPADPMFAVDEQWLTHPLSNPHSTQSTVFVTGADAPSTASQSNRNDYTMANLETGSRGATHAGTTAAMSERRLSPLPRAARIRAPRAAPMHPPAGTDPSVDGFTPASAERYLLPPLYDPTWEADYSQEESHWEGQSLWSGDHRDGGEPRSPPPMPR